MTDAEAFRCSCTGAPLPGGGLYTHLTLASTTTRQCWHRATQEDGLCDWCRDGHPGEFMDRVTARLR